MPTEKYAGVPEVERWEGVSDSQLCVAKRTEVQPIILLRVKICCRSQDRAGM
jgi:hypothetical protein